MPNKHLLESLGSPETASDGRCQAVGPVSPSRGACGCERVSPPGVVSPESSPGPVECDLCLWLPGCPGLLRVSLVVSEQEPFCPSLHLCTQPGSQ